MAACKDISLKNLAPCVVYPELDKCLAVPLDETQAPYDRLLEVNDVCIPSDDYANVQKHYRDLLKKCGNKCRSL